MKVLKIGFVGGPQSGKTSLIEYLRNYLKADYHVVIAEEAPTVCLRAGLNPPYNISSLDFQLECLKEYQRIYERIDDFQKYESDKPTVILFDTVPQIGCTYLKNGDSKSYKTWRSMLDSMLTFDIFKEYMPDKIYNLELLQDSYSPKGNAVRRVLDTNKVLSIAEKINELFSEEDTLSNQLSLEERAAVVVDYIEDYFDDTPDLSIDSSKTTITLYTSCYNCGWSDNVDISKPYHYCPMCGKILISLSPHNPSYPYSPTNPVNPYDPNRITYTDHTTVDPSYSTFKY